MIQYVAVLPAYAGMFPYVRWIAEHCHGSPRVCGDVSGIPETLPLVSLFSPRMRGCF